MSVSRTNAGLIVALVPLITLLLWDVARGREPATLTVEWPAVVAGEVDGLRIVNESGEVVARRVGTQWTVVAASGDGGEAVSMAADPDLIRGVLRSFRSPIRPDARVAARAEELDVQRVYGYGVHVWARSGLHRLVRVREGGVEASVTLTMCGHV